MKKAISYLLISLLVGLSAEAYAAPQNQSSDLIYQAALDGDYDKLEALVEQGHDVNAKMHRGQTLLHVVSEPIANAMIGFDMTEMEKGGVADKQRQVLQDRMKESRNTSERLLPLVKWLIAHGANVDAKDDRGNTPLHVAAKNGYLKHAEALIAGGANINSLNERNQTPFYTAMENSRMNTSSVKMMLQQNPDLKAGMGKRTPNDNFWNDPYIYLAVDSGDPDLIKYFIDRGARLDEENSQGQTAYQEAIRMNDPKVLDYISSLSATQNDLSAVKAAALFDYVGDDLYLPEMRKLLKQGVNVNVKNEEGCTPLHIAIHGSSSSYGMVKLLLENGANPNSIDRRGRTIVGDAAMQGNIKIVGMLVDKGADVNMSGEAGTPLHWASTGTMRKFLISKGARR